MTKTYRFDEWNIKDINYLKSKYPMLTETDVIKCTITSMVNIICQCDLNGIEFDITDLRATNEFVYKICKLKK